MWEIFLNIASIAATFLSIIAALYAIFSSFKNDYTAVKMFIKCDFAKSALMLVPLPLTLYQISNTLELNIGPISEKLLFSILALAFIMILVLQMIRVVNGVYYCFLQYEGLSNYEYIHDDKIHTNNIPTPVIIKRHNIDDIICRIYHRLKPNDFWSSLKTIDKDIFESVIDDLINKFVHGCDNPVFSKNNDVNTWFQVNASINVIGRGKLVPSIQSPVYVCNLCSSILYSAKIKTIVNNNYKNDVLKQASKQSIVILYVAIIYSIKHQDSNFENILFGRDGYTSPTDTLYYLMMATLIAFVYADTNNNDVKLLITKLYEISYNKDVNNIYALHNMKCWKNPIATPGTCVSNYFKFV